MEPVSKLPADIGLVELLREDRRANGYGYTYPGFHAVAVHRLGVWAANQGGVAGKLVGVLYKLGFTFVRNFYGIEIPRTVQVGRRLCVGHQSGIVIHPNAVIGDDCIIRFNSSLAGASTEHHQWAREAPRLGNDVTIGVGAIVVGNVTVGDGARIGPNAVVTRSVPPGTVVVVDPPRYIETKPREPFPAR
jgi:serine O-acetyltransferase